MKNKIRQTVGYYLFIGIIVINSIVMGIDSYELMKKSRYPENAVTDYEKRFYNLKRDIEKIKNLGFYSPEKNTKWWYQFNLVQYSLIPAYIINSVNEKYVIGDFFFFKGEKINIPENLKIYKKYHNKLYLFVQKENRN